MKKIFILFASTLVVLTLALFSACENNLEKFTLSAKGAPDNISVNPNTNFVCTLNNANDTAFIFSWSEADFGEHIAVIYSLQFDVVGNNFSSPHEISAGNKITTLIVTSEELNSTMHALGQPIETPTNIEVRVKALPVVLGSAQPSLTPLFSESIVTVNLTSYAIPPMHMLGSMFDNYLDDPTMVYFWNFSNYKYVMFRDNPLTPDVCIAQLKAVNGTGLQGEMAFIEDARLGSYTFLNKDQEGTLKYGGSNINVSQPGYYEVKVDFAKMTYSLSSYDASGATTYTTLQLSGSSVVSSVSLLQSHYEPHIWEADNVVLTTGNVKFTANASTVFGGDSFPWGKGVVNGDDINILKAGTYFIKFNDLTGHYIFYQK
jgi:hypothetical protein